MKLKIISDGTVVGTNVVNAETGERVENVRAIRWEADAEGVGCAGDIQIFPMPVEISGEFKTHAS